MAIPRLPSGDERFLWQYREVTGAEPAPLVDQATVSALETLGFVPQGRAGSHLPDNLLQLILQEVFAHPIDGSWGVLSRSYDRTHDVVVFYSLMEDGTVVTTELTPRRYWVRHGIGLLVGVDAHYVAKYLYAPDPAALYRVHEALVAKVARQRKTTARFGLGLDTWLAMRTARARARVGWTARELNLAGPTSLALAALGLLTPVLVAWLWAARLAAMTPRGVGLGLFLVIALASISLLRRSRLLAYRWVAPLLMVVLTLGRQQRSTDVAGVLAERKDR